MRGAAKRSLSTADDMDFRILGPLQVTEGARTVPLGGASLRALLAFLLLHANEVVSNDRLLDELWTGKPPGSGVTALQVRVSQLRKALGPAADRLETRAPGYVLLVGQNELDLDRFSRLVEEADDAEPAAAAEKLREALALWRGPPLADLAYESFAQAAIRRMDELRLAAIEARLEADLALGVHAELVGELEALVAEHPLRDRLRAQLMLALYRSGRQADALSVYRATRLAFQDELGIEPGPALQNLERAMLTQDPDLELVRLPPQERSILVAPRADDKVDLLLGLAEPLARRPPKELILIRLVSDANMLRQAAVSLEQRRVDLIERGTTARTAALVSTAPSEEIVRLAVEQDVDLVLVDGSAELLRDPALGSLLTSAPCDVAVLVRGEVRRGPVLVPFVGAEHDWAGIELAAWAAGALDVPLLLVGPRERPGSRDASRLLANASLAVQATLGVAAEPLLVEPEPTALLAAAEEAALVVVGLSERWRQEGLGEVRETLAVEARAPVVLIRRGLRPGGLAPRQSLTRFTWSLRA